MARCSKELGVWRNACSSKTEARTCKSRRLIFLDFCGMGFLMETSFAVGGGKMMTDGMAMNLYITLKENYIRHTFSDINEMGYEVR